MSRLGKAPRSTHSNIKLYGGRREKTGGGQTWRGRESMMKMLRRAGILNALAGRKTWAEGGSGEQVLRSTAFM